MSKQKIVRTVPLTEEQSERALKEQKQLKCMSEALADLFIEICERKMEREDDFWKAIGSIAKPEPGQTLQVNWITSEIEVLEKE